MNTIKLLYIDDIIDLTLLEFIETYKENYNLKSNYSLEIRDYPFSSSGDYNTLLEDPKIEADIIIINSKLFEDDSSDYYKLTVKEVESVFKNVNSCSMVIVLTENDGSNKYNPLCKFNSIGIPANKVREKALSFYEINLKPTLDDSIIEVICKNSKRIDTNTIVRLSMEKTALKKEISTLKKALELACNYGEYWSDKAATAIEVYFPTTAEKLRGMFIKQAQEEQDG